MNEKFFDLKKEKQDRIMGAAMEMFAVSGYEHASTDDMVKRAHISKGLLFHYFGSKLGLYAFLYDYCVRFVSLEFSRNIPQDVKGFFAVQEALLDAWSDAIRQYPFIRLFLVRAEYETNEEALNETREKRAAYKKLTEDIAARYARTKFSDEAQTGQIDNLLRFAYDSLLTEADKREENWQEAYLTKARAYLELLKRLTDGKISEPADKKEGGNE